MEGFDIKWGGIWNAFTHTILNLFKGTWNWTFLVFLDTETEQIFGTILIFQDLNTTPVNIYQVGCTSWNVNSLLTSTAKSYWQELKRFYAAHVMKQHLLLDKMAAISADDIFKCIFVNENHRILIEISLKFVPRGPIDNKLALIKRMAWRQIGSKPLSEPMLTRFIDAYMRQ